MRLEYFCDELINRREKVNALFKALDEAIRREDSIVSKVLKEAHENAKKDLARLSEYNLRITIGDIDNPPTDGKKN